MWARTAWRRHHHSRRDLNLHTEILGVHALKVPPVMKHTTSCLVKRRIRAISGIISSGLESVASELGVFWGI